MSFSFLRRRDREQQYNPYGGYLQSLDQPQNAGASASPRRDVQSGGARIDPRVAQQNLQRAQQQRRQQNQGESIPQLQQRYRQQQQNRVASQQQQRQPQQQYNPGAFLTNQYLQQRDNAAQQRIGGIKERARSQLDLQKELLESRQNTLGNIANLAGESYGNYADQLRSGLDIQRGTAQRQKQSTRADYDEQRLQREQSRQERMKGLEGALASLGTLQSSSFENLGTKINMGAQRMDAQAQRDLNNRLADIDDAVRLAENEVEGLIQQEGARYQQQLEQIRGALDENSIEYKQAINTITDQANQRINNLFDSLDQFNYEAQIAAIKAQQEAGGGLSDAFLTTGEPQTRADYQWMAENPDNYQEIVNRRMQQTGELSQEKVDMVNTINQLLAEDTTPITGTLQLRSYVPGTQAQKASNLYKRLEGMLTLENVDKLRGTGAVSDREFAVLQQAASQIGRNLSDDDFRNILIQLRNELDPMGYAQQQAMGGGQGSIYQLANQYENY